MSENTILETRDLTVEFGGVTAVDKITMRVNQGETLGILGPNGSGKTSMFRALLGTIPHSGEVRFFNQGQAMRRHLLPFVGYVPQRIEFEPIFPATVADVILMGLNALKKSSRVVELMCKECPECMLGPKKSKSQKLDDVLEMFGMTEKRNSRISDLSGGERQKVFVAHALVRDPPLIICDEPVSNADVNFRDMFYSVLNEAKEKRGMTVIISLHDLATLKKYTDKVACIDRSLLFYGNTADFFEDDALLGMYTTASLRGEHHHE